MPFVPAWRTGPEEMLEAAKAVRAADDVSADPEPAGFAATSRSGVSSYAIKQVTGMGSTVLRRSALLLSVGTLALLVALDIALGPDTPLNGTFGIAAVVAAMLTTVRRTALVGALAIGTSFLAGVWNDGLGTHDWLVRSLLCSLLVVLSVALAAIRVRREKALLNMTVIAETAQRALLRSLPEEIQGLRLSARYLSAAEGAFVGGDLYDVAVTPYGVRVLVGDARGKGLEAVQMAGTVLGAFRRAAFERAALADVAADLDRVAAAVAGDEDFVTALLVEVHDGDRMSVVNCGHHPPLLLTPDQPTDLLDTGPPTQPLGLGALPVPVTSPWSPGARVLLYTDGLVEARDPSGSFFPLLDNAEVLRSGTVAEGLDQLLDRLTRHTTTRLRDDLVLLLVENSGAQGDDADAGTARQHAAHRPALQR